MKEKKPEHFEFSEEVKERIIGLVLYQKQSAKEVAKKYDLQNVHIISNWVRIYKKNLEKGAILLPPMENKKRKDSKALRQRI